jgi:polyisoprenoid-binding protein YceI
MDAFAYTPADYPGGVDNMTILHRSPSSLKVLAPLLSVGLLILAAVAQPAAWAQLGPTRVSAVPGASEARYRAHEQLVAQTLPNDPIGRTTDVSGELLLTPDGGVDSAASKIVVDLRTLTSDEEDRDEYIQRETLQTAQFPYAEFTPTSVSGLPMPLPTSGSSSFQLTGPLTVHGQTKVVTWDSTASFTGNVAVGTASVKVKITDFGMTPPQIFPVLSIQDELTLEIDYRASIAQS